MEYNVVQNKMKHKPNPERAVAQQIRKLTRQKTKLCKKVYRRNKVRVQESKKNGDYKAETSRADLKSEGITPGKTLMRPLRDSGLLAIRMQLWVSVMTKGDLYTKRRCKKMP